MSHAEGCSRRDPGQREGLLMYKSFGKLYNILNDLIRLSVYSYNYISIRKVEMRKIIKRLK